MCLDCGEDKLSFAKPYLQDQVRIYIHIIMLFIICLLALHISLTIRLTLKIKFFIYTCINFYFHHAFVCYEPHASRFCITFIAFDSLVSPIKLNEMHLALGIANN